MPRKKRQVVSMKPSRAIQMLRRIKNTQPDELGDLGFILASETSSLVRCNNHSFTVAMQKQMDIWYRHHVTTMRKISHGQQSEYQNLMKVKNDKRKMYRTGVMRQRDEVEFDYRMKADRDRNATEVKLLNLSLDDKKHAVEDGVDLARKEADRSGWLRIRRRDQLSSSDLLPTIHDVGDDRYRDSSPTFSTPAFVEDWKDMHKNIVDSDTDEHNGHSTFTSEGHRGHVNDVFTLESNVDEQDGGDDHDDVGTMRGSLPTARTENLVGHTSSSDTEPCQDQTINEASRSHRDQGDHIRYIRDSRRHGQNKLSKFVESCARSSKEHDQDGKPVGRDMETLSDMSRDFKDVKGCSEDMNSLQMDPAIKHPDRSITAIHPVIDIVAKRDANVGSDPQERDNDEMLDTKDDWTIQSKRLQKLPSLHLQPIDQVIRYHRQEADRALIGTVTAVRPSNEKFPLPSKKAQYHRRKALQWHVEQAPALHTKIQQFLSGCDAIPRPAPTLHTPRVFFFSRHNPEHTTSASVDHVSTGHRADAMTKKGNEILYDLEAIKRNESALRGRNVAITKEMVSRKHGTVTPHK